MSLDLEHASSISEKILRFPYRTSEPIGFYWGGQLPLSMQVDIQIKTRLVDDLYAVTIPPEIIPLEDQDLIVEIAAWDAASDEALSNFEDILD